MECPSSVSPSGYSPSPDSHLSLKLSATCPLSCCYLPVMSTSTPPPLCDVSTDSNPKAMLPYRNTNPVRLFERASLNHRAERLSGATRMRDRSSYVICSKKENGSAEVAGTHTREPAAKVCVPSPLPQTGEDPHG